MTLEEFTAQLNATTFWKEFTFSETRFLPRPKQQVELADGIVKIGSLAFIFQLKERTEETSDPDAERHWFQRKVLRKATDQIKASMRYLAENEEIRLANGHGYEIAIRGADLEDVKDRYIPPWTVAPWGLLGGQVPHFGYRRLRPYPGRE